MPYSQSRASSSEDITTGGAITEFPIPTVDSVPDGITAGPDGNLWFTESFVNQIGRITTAGDIVEFRTRGGPAQITAGPDGNLWFTALLGNRIGRITTTGAVKDSGRKHGISPYGITAGPDGNLWFAESGGNAIAEFRLR